jgi:hypothetical protein
MKTLTKLDISGNSIEQGKILEQIAAICSAKSTELTGAGFGEQELTGADLEDY